ALLPDGPRERRGGAARGGARHRGGRRHRHGEAGAPLSRRRAPRKGALRVPGRRLPRERRVRDGEGRSGARLDRRGARGRGEPGGHPPRGRRHHHHVLRAGRGAGARTAMRRRGSTLAAALGLAMALAGQVGAAGEGGEGELGRRFFLAARSELPLVEDPAVTEYVGQIGARLVKTLGAQEFDYRFYVVQSPVLNAFAVPGGYVFIFSGLLARVANDDELAGVLGHEMGHVRGHHIVRQQEKGQVWSAAALLGLLLSAVNPVAGAAGIAAAETAQLKFSREFEQEADFLGLRTMSTAGYDPHAMGTFFKTLLTEQRINPAGVPAYMLTHPVTEDRVSHVETTISAQKLKTPAGRPAAAIELPEAQAVARAIADPPDVVIPRFRRLAEEKPDDAGRKGDEAEGFYHLALSSRLRGELEQALSQFQQTDRRVTPGSARQAEVERAIAELEPLVRERARERQERRRTGRRGFGAR